MALQKFNLVRVLDRKSEVERALAQARVWSESVERVERAIERKKGAHRHTERVGGGERKRNRKIETEGQRGTEIVGVLDRKMPASHEYMAG